MTVTSWRIAKSRYSETPFDGEGARRYGGRWNSPGTALIYTCESEALAALEMLVHLQSSQLLLEYSSIRVTFDAALIEEVDPASLPDDWQRYPAPVALQQLGDQWAAQGRSVVLVVPSIIVPRSSNFLLNPKHPDFRQVEIGTPVPFDFDARLK